MPKYDFVCLTCDRTVELQLAVDQTTRPACEGCGGFMTKAFTPPTIHFKGGGWGGQ